MFLASKTSDNLKTEGISALQEMGRLLEAGEPGETPAKKQRAADKNH